MEPEAEGVAASRWRLAGPLTLSWMLHGGGALLVGAWLVSPSPFAPSPVVVELAGGGDAGGGAASSPAPATRAARVPPAERSARATRESAPSLPPTVAPPSPASPPLALTPAPSAPVAAVAPAPGPAPAASEARGSTTVSEPGPAATGTGGVDAGGAAATRATPGHGGGGASPPRLGRHALPRYPENARRAGVEGTTLLRVRVRADGSVAEVRVERSAGHADLDAAAVDAVGRWRFEPARRQGAAVDTWIELPVQFTLT